VDPTNHNVYVADVGTESMSVIDESGDTGSGTVTKTLGAGEARGIAVDPGTHKVFVGDAGSVRAFVPSQL
jgi:DNA-binding beta-propeller fold protein YncE